MKDFIAIKVDENLSAEKIVVSVKKLMGSVGDLEDAFVVISLKKPSSTDESYALEK